MGREELGFQHTLLIGFVADLGYTAGDAGNEGASFADAFRVEVAACGNRARDA